MYKKIIPKYILVLFKTNEKLSKLCSSPKALNNDHVIKEMETNNIIWFLFILFLFSKIIKKTIKKGVEKTYLFKLSKLVPPFASTLEYITVTNVTNAKYPMENK